LGKVDDMEWLNKPTGPGQYWIYTFSMWKVKPVIECVKVVINDGAIEFDIPCGGYECENDIAPERTTHWMGPLRVPQPPQE